MKLSLYFPYAANVNNDILVPHLAGLGVLLQSGVALDKPTTLTEMHRHLVGIVDQAPLNERDGPQSDIHMLTNTLDKVIKSSSYDRALSMAAACLKDAYGEMEDAIGEWMLNRAHLNVNDSPEQLGRAAVMVMNHFSTAHTIGERAGYAVVDLLGHEKIQGNSKLSAQMGASLEAALVPHSKLARAYETAMNYEAAVQGIEPWRLTDVHNYIIPAGAHGNAAPHNYLIM